MKNKVFFVVTKKLFQLVHRLLLAVIIVVVPSIPNFQRFFPDKKKLEFKPFGRVCFRNKRFRKR